METMPAPERAGSPADAPSRVLARIAAWRAPILVLYAVLVPLACGIVAVFAPLLSSHWSPDVARGMVALIVASGAIGLLYVAAVMLLRVVRPSDLPWRT